VGGGLVGFEGVMKEKEQERERWTRKGMNGANPVGVCLVSQEG
jgi:hypothetical protein